MEGPSAGGEAKTDILLNHLREFSRCMLRGSGVVNARKSAVLSRLQKTLYYTGYPRKEQISRVQDFKSERQFVELLHQGQPVAVAFTLRCPWTQRFDRVLEDAAAEWYPHIKFVRVECPKYPGFCIARQRKDYPFVEIFHSPKQAETQEGVKESSVARYSVKVTPYNYDMSAYGFREFFKRQTSLAPPLTADCKYTF